MYVILVFEQSKIVSPFFGPIIGVTEFGFSHLKHTSLV